MEPTNIDNQFREGLKNQEIQPSAAAWDRLDAMLSVAEKPKKSYNWMYVAASFLGFMIIGTVFYFQSQPMIDQQKNIEVVETNQNTIPNKIESKKDKINQNEVAIIEEKVSNQNPKIQKTISIFPKIIKEKTGVQSSSQPINQNKIQEIASHSYKLESPQEILIEKPSQKPNYIDVASLLAEVESKKASSKSDLNLPKATYKIEAKALLSQVDGELEQSFRQKVMQKIAKNYQTIKVAVVERNEK